MTGFNHGMTGAVIALAVKQPILALPISLASHYITDMIPHFGFKQHIVLGKKFNIFHSVDFVLSVVFMIVLGMMFPSSRLLIWACMVAAAIPDILWWFHRRTVKDWPAGLDRFSAWHYKINDKSHQQHLYYDLVWLGAAWAIVLHFYFQWKLQP